MKAFLKYLTLFLVGGAFYYALEMLFRGYSFLAMAGCGGLCFIICGVLNEKDRCMPLVLQMAIAAFGITAIEFVFGLVLNVWLDLGMWDYSNMPGNILGQICPQFMVLAITCQKKRHTACGKAHTARKLSWRERKGKRESTDSQCRKNSIKSFRSQTRSE